MKKNSILNRSFEMLQLGSRRMKLMTISAIAGFGLLTSQAADAACTVPTVTGSSAIAASCPGGGSLDVDATGGGT